MAYTQQLWDEAKRKCKIVEEWIHDIYDKSQVNSRKKAERKKEKITFN